MRQKGGATDPFTWISLYYVGMYITAGASHAELHVFSATEALSVYTYVTGFHIISDVV